MYGELKTYVEFDFNQTGTYQLGGNNDLLRLRQAYGTLGPGPLVKPTPCTPICRVGPTPPPERKMPVI